ncbi:MAG: hypothetical protein KDC98_12705 [Planctomycetes bacterium]|nr:hypothetical protein [Planctomycetota bacterium]
MTKPAPDHHDAELILKFYDLRREPVMRQSRDAMLRDFWPRNADEAMAVLSPDHPQNQAFRQVVTYWEMVYGMAKYGVVHTDLLLESNGEGLFVYAKFEPYVAQMREQWNPRAFEKAQWISNSGPLAEKILGNFRARVKRRLEG